MSKSQQRKGSDGERELCAILHRAGYPVKWGGTHTYGTVPDISGLPGIHVECKRVEKLNIMEAMTQSVRDAERFQDGLPAVFHRRDEQPWLVTMRLTDWLKIYKETETENIMNYWEQEHPLVVDTGKNVLEYYAKARRLAVCKPDWTDRQTGAPKRGKTVVLDLNAVKESPAATELIRTIAAELED